MNPATRKAIIAQAKWDVAEMHRIEKHQRERARIHDLARREAAEDESEPGVVATYQPKDKRRRAQREEFYTEKGGAWWVELKQRKAGEHE
jgi:hypothetical protein